MRKRIISPFDLFRPAMSMGWMLAEAQTVIALRMLGMAGALPSARDEPLRMMTEKIAAAQEAGLAVARAQARGADGAAIVMAGLRPVRRRTKANVKRLTGAARSK
jgi:hypothetical protein